MPDQPQETFGQVLRQLRQGAGMTLEDLAARTGLAVRTISSLERSEGNSPRVSTVSKLAEALGLGAPGRTWLWALAQGEPVPGGLLAASATTPHTLPRDIGPFVGRSPELARLAAGESGGGVVTIYAITGMAGIGKTALAVRAAHQLAPQFPDGQLFLRLNGHTLGQRPVEPAAALASLLLAAGADAQQVPAGLDDRAQLWRHWLAGRKVLLVLDDATGSEQVRPLLPGAAGSLVLVTSRRNLTALAGARSVSLDVLSPAESARLLVRLADRPGLDPGDPALAQLAGLCGKLPLALGMLGGQLHYNRAWEPADLAADLAHARDRLERLHAEEASVAAAFDLSYRDLTRGQQRMFRRLGLHPGADTDVYAAAALDGASVADARRCLRALCDQNMISEPSYGRYRFHDLIRGYAGQRAAAEDAPADRAAALGRLLDYYRHAATEAGRYLARRTFPAALGDAGPGPACFPGTRSRAQAAAWLAAESLNLQAAAARAAADGQPHATAIAAALHGFLRGQGHWGPARELHQAALRSARQRHDRTGEAGALTDLGDIQYLTGEYAAAEASFTRALDLARGRRDALAEASALVGLGVLRQTTGDLPAAEAHLTRALELSAAQGDGLGEASALNNLGIVQFMAGNFTAAAASQKQALSRYRGLGDQLGEASTLNSMGGVEHATGDYPAAIASLTQALELYRGLGDQVGQAYATGNLGSVQCIVGDYQGAAGNLRAALDLYRDLGRRNGEADMLANLGALHRMSGDLPSATASLTQAVTLYRDINDPLGEAGALSELGVAQRAAGDYRAATASLTQAVRLARDLGERADEAEALNNLGDLYLEASTGAAARDAYRQALGVAADIDSPLQEARALEGTGRCLLRDGERDAGAELLRKALRVYQRIDSAGAGPVAATLQGLDA